MARSFKGRPVIPGDLSGECVVRRDGLNPLETFLEGQSEINGKVLCLPQTIGSTTGGMFIQVTAEDGSAPEAMLFSKHIDSLGAAGVILARVWNAKKIITVDNLGDDFLEYVQDEMRIEIMEDGTVLVG